MAAETICSEITGSVWKILWKILVKPGDVLEADGTLMVLESMKMEIPVLAQGRRSGGAGSRGQE